MNAIVLAALVAAPPAAPAALDLDCFRLMAELSRQQNPEARALGLAAANFFLGRIDAAAQGFDVRAASGAPAGDRADLVRRCGETLGAAGFDLGALRRSLQHPAPTA